ncbi:hypothetical protein ACJJIG_18040 [Microbulbifer sp. SSSA007]
MSSVYVTTKTLQTGAGQPINVEVVYHLAVHSSIAVMAIPSG